MRVIAGRLGGRRLQAPRGRGTRPTSDRVREALFSSIGDEIVGAHVLDLYAGSGALGIEALSRGAASVTFVERAPAALRALRANLHALELDACVVGTAVAGVPAALGDTGTFDVVLADPPYDVPLTEVTTVLGRMRDSHLADDALVVIERDRRSDESLPGWLDLHRQRTYGDTVLVFARVGSGVQG